MAREPEAGCTEARGATGDPGSETGGDSADDSPESVGPLQHVRFYDKYSAPVSGQAEDDVQQFLREKHPFHDTMVEAMRYKDLADDIECNSKVIRLGMFLVHSSQLINALVRRAKGLYQKLVDRMLEDHQIINKQLCEDFEKIAVKCLSTPHNTKQLMDLASYVEKVERQEMPALEKTIQESKKHFWGLMDYTTLSQEDVRLNLDTFRWHGRMAGIFSDYCKMVKEKTEQFQEGLKLRCESFMEALESYSRQVEDFVSFMDVADLNKYLTKAQALNSKLDAAVDQIDGFNMEEEAFNLPVFQYPLRKETHDRLGPYLRLYETACEFQARNKAWLEGPLDTLEQ